MFTKRLSHPVIVMTNSGTERIQGHKKEVSRRIQQVTAFHPEFFCQIGDFSCEELKTAVFAICLKVGFESKSRCAVARLLLGRMVHDSA